MNTHGIRDNTHGIRWQYNQRIRILSEYVFCSGISLVGGCLARVLREQHFSVFLHVLYSVCILCVFSCILENTVYSVVFCGCILQIAKYG